MDTATVTVGAAAAAPTPATPATTATQQELTRQQYDLAKQLQCPVCLDTFTLPVARLPCMHYFCGDCIKMCLDTGNTTCPHCKLGFKRRDIQEDEFASRLIEKFTALEGVQGWLRDAIKALEIRGTGTGTGAVGDPAAVEAELARQRIGNMMLPWVQGVDDDEYETPTQSFGGLEEAEEAEEVAAGGVGDGGEAGAQGPARGCDDVVPPSESEGDEPFVVMERKEHMGRKEKGKEKGKGGSVGAILEGLEDSISQEAAGAAGSVDKGKKKLIESSAEEEKENVGGVNTEGGGVGKKKKKKKKKEADGKTEKSKATMEKKETKTATKTATKKENVAVEKAGKSAAQSTRKAATKAKAKANSPAPTPMAGQLTVPLSCDADTGSRRRVPARLQPWTCGACTFENKGAANDCEICGTSKGADAVAGQVVAEQKSIAKEAKKAGDGGSGASNVPSALHAANVGNASNASNAPNAPNAPNGANAEGKRKRKGASAAATAEETEKSKTTVPCTEEQEEGVSTTPPPTKKTKLSARERRLLKSSEKRKERRGKGAGVEPVVCGLDKKATGTNTVNASNGTNTSKTERSIFEGVVATSSNLSAEDKDLLEVCVPKFKSTLTHSDDVTHVICPTSKDPVYTPKFLTALLKGIHIVSMKWITDCMEKGEHVDERNYSLKPANWKQKDAKRDINTKILAKYEIQIAVPPLSKEQNPAGTSKALGRVETLLQAAGAKIVQRLPRKIEGSDKRCLVLVIDSTLRNPNDPNEASQIVQQSWFARAQGADIPVVKQQWLKESILAGNALDDYDTYRI